MTLFKSFFALLIGVLFLTQTPLVHGQVVHSNPVPGASISNGTGPGGQDQVKNPDGQVVAEPFADAVAIEVLPDGSALVTDKAMGFIVGFGGSFGNQFVPFGEVPGANQLFWSSDKKLYVTGQGGNVWRVNVEQRTVTYICGGVTNPSDVRESVSDGGKSIHLVEDATAGIVTIADASSGETIGTAEGSLREVLAQTDTGITAGDPFFISNEALGKSSQDGWLLNMWWLLLLFVPFLLSSLYSLFSGKKAVAKTPQYDAKKDQHAGSVDMVGKDPCDELRKKMGGTKTEAEEDEEESQEADQAKTDTEKALSDADQAVKDAEKAERDAEHDLQDAKDEVSRANEQPVEGDSATSDDYTFTGRDKKLKDRAVQGIKDAHAAGDITAQEQSAQISELNSKAGTDRLRKEDNENRAQRQKEAKEDLATATQAATDAAEATAETKTAADKASDAAKEASENADAAKEEAAESKAKAKSAKEAYDLCMKTSREAWAKEEAERKADYQKSLDDQEKWEPPKEKPIDEIFGVTGGGGKKRECCPCSVWIGVGYGGGGTFFVGGKEYAHMLWFCSCDSSIYVEVVIETWRAGPGLGGEGTIHVGVISGATHASQIPGLLKGDADGVGWDLSLGGSAKQAASAAEAGAETAGMLKNLAKAVKNAGTKDAPLSSIAKNENVAKAAKSLAQSAQSTSVKTATGAAESGGQVIKIAVGPSLQVGLWYGFGSSVFVNSYNSCGCKVK